MTGKRNGKILCSQMNQGLLFLSQMVIQEYEEAYNNDCIQPTLKFGSRSVIFWGCFSWYGVGPLVVVEQTLNSEEYVNVLSNNFISWARNYPNLIFQQDGASFHTSSYTTWWMESHGILVLNWVMQSPDLNPIEYL
ncbi:16812_t:CDS:1 [Funneliformis geosporum]|uniref:16812_t:CDS:1 n=1 Tax=Funneliformis geosporum TaxID=1117311 RepID=A0A9W4T6M8_9GLOM|nr:16812_t:CDS:1 [Funneliformis geosporum]